MKLYLSLLFCVFSTANVYTQQKLDSLLLEIDNIIINHEKYVNKKNDKIRVLKDKYTKSTSLENKYLFSNQLYKEYKSYVLDSAINYLNEGIELAVKLDDTSKEYQNKINLAKLLGSSGLYKEASDILSNIDTTQLSDDLLVEYYIGSDHVFGELGYYAQDTTLSSYYTKQSSYYKDRLFKTLPDTDERIRIIQETAYRDKNNYTSAKRINDSRIQEAHPNSHDFAVVAFHRALLERQQGNIETEKYYLALSAIIDIKLSTTDHASLWMLARLLYDDGDIERANRYMQFSWKETIFYNAKLRNIQSSDIMSLIDGTYKVLIERQNTKLTILLIVGFCLLILLSTTILYIILQNKKLLKARNQIQDANKQLKELNQQLVVSNELLYDSNADLNESNQIKDEYIGRFINLCSAYIEKLDTYRKMVYKKLINNQISELKDITKSSTGLDKELQSLLDNFDHAFLHLFPNFVKDFNNLLFDEEKIVLKKGELLNTELRIFALIRLGIDDSSKIAEFLHYSVNTIYNYRAKVKNKSRVDRDNFENLVKKLK